MASKLQEVKGSSLKSIRFSDDNNKEKIPEGAIILKKDVTVNVEEIENGFIICKNYDVKYMMKGKDGDGNTNYAYYTEKYYSEDNPLTINTDDKNLADLFDEDDN